MPISVGQLEGFNHNNIFIETGTGGGLGTVAAVKAGFKTIHTIEFYDMKYEIAEKRLKGYDNITMHKGDSGIVLNEILSNINEPVTFWLDSHFSHGKFYNKPLTDTCPVLKELDIIRNHHIKSHTILIDDIRCFREVTKLWNSITLEQIISKIDPIYDIYYIDGYTENDILVAEVK